MAQSDLIIRITAGLLTPNEVRVQEGLSPVTDGWFELLTGIRSASKAFEDWGDVYEKLYRPLKIACEYFYRPNNIEIDLCASCGAPLPLQNGRNRQ
jgi:hypothetical protein